MLREAMKYFAYDNNLAPGVLKAVSASLQPTGPARLDDYRLAFTRRSDKWGGGVADIVQSQGVCVWGFLFEIDEKGVVAIESEEEYGSAYKRAHLRVKLLDDKEHDAIAHTVVNKEAKEVPPGKEYLQAMIDGARKRNLDKHYVKSLESIALEERDRFREGFLVRPTIQRTEAIGVPLIRVSSGMARTFRRNRLCVVSYRGKAALAAVAHNDDLPPNVCELDQSVRSALSIKGRLTFGVFVQLLPTLQRSTDRYHLLKPRFLVLPMYRPSVLDCEKQICVLHPHNIRLLGLAQGDYITVTSAVANLERGYSVCKLSRRVFAGTPATLHGPSIKKVGYPEPHKFYIDLDGRLALGLSRDDQAMPVLISADTTRLFLSRVLHYGATLLVGLLAIYPLLQTACAALKLSPLWGVVGTITLAYAITVAITLVDLRSRVQY